MNKKFSTLVAGLLTVCAANMTAQTSKIDGNLDGLATKGSYFKLHVGETKNTEATVTDSILSVKDGILRVEAQNSSDPHALWKVIKTATKEDGPVFHFVNLAGDTLNFPTAKAGEFAAYKATVATGDVNQLRFWESPNGGTGVRFLSDKGPAAGWVFQQGYVMYKENGTDKDKDGYNYSLTMFNLVPDASDDAVAGLKLVSFSPVPVEAPALGKDSIASGSTVIEELPVTGNVYIVDGDGKYIGVSGTTLRSTASVVKISAKEFEALSEVQRKPFAWSQNGGLKNAYSVEPTYLTLDESGEFATSDKPVAATIENNQFVSGGQLLPISSLLTASNPIPFNAPADWADKVAKQDAGKVVLFYSGIMDRAVKHDNTVGQYSGNAGEEFVWTLKPVETTKGQYELRLSYVDAAGKTVYLTANNAYVTVENATITQKADGSLKYELPTNGLTSLKAGSEWIAITNGEVTAVSVKGYANQFGLGQIGVAYMQANSLLTRFGSYFTLGITYKNADGEDVDLSAPFKGQLRPVSEVNYSNSETEYIDAVPTATDFMLVNAKGDIIVAKTTDILSDGKDSHAYALTTITPKEYALAKALDTDGKADTYNPYMTNFMLTYTPGEKQPEVSKVLNIQVTGYINGVSLDKTIGRLDIKGVPTLAAAAETDLKAVAVKLNASSLVVAKSWLNKIAYYTVEVKNVSKNTTNHYGKVLGLGEYGQIQYVDPAKTNIGKPEGQFAITYNEVKNTYDFTNRESRNEGFSLTASSLYKINDNTFAYLDDSHIDTLSIKAITDFAPTDGFKRFTAANLNANTYNVAMNLLDESFLYVVENHNDKHRLGLDREEATNWRVEMPTVRLLDATSDLIKLVPDTVTISVPVKYYKNADEGFVYSKDVKDGTALKVCTYILKNTATDEYISGTNDSEETGNSYYYCPSKTGATRFALKQIGDSTVNLVPAYQIIEKSGYYSWMNWSNSQEFKEADYKTYANQLGLSSQKVIGGTTSATGVLKDVNMYNAISNDLFVIKEATAPTYKSLNQGDKIKISRVANTDEVVYEQKEFLGIDNAKAYEKINPTLYVDTAYINREGNYRYEYLLGVNINRVDKTDSCTIPGHEHLRTVFTEGRFLVNMKDSADANTNVHTNKYSYDGESKLSFVPGYHQNDTLYFTDKAGQVVSKTEVGNAAHNFAKFAFKMIDEANNEFVIETGIDYATKWFWNKDNKYSWESVNGNATPGYLRWHNGNLVVTKNIDEAEHFTMAESKQEATSNDQIGATEVQVIAGNGAVVIKGAAGKLVVVNNILGQTIASTVLTSDNATIAVPAGIVVVAVEGEEAVKTVVQ